jgi:hypothetical protein
MTQVFPGGNYDEKRDESYQMTAIREAFEETGLLLASPTMPESNGTRRLSDAVLDAMRASIHAEETFFDDFLKKYGLIADVEALHPFTEWITPLGPPRCVYSTRTIPTCVHRINSVSSPLHTTQSIPRTVLHHILVLLFTTSLPANSRLQRAKARSDRDAIRASPRRARGTPCQENRAPASTALHPHHTCRYPRRALGNVAATRAREPIIGRCVWTNGRSSQSW